MFYPFLSLNATIPTFHYKIESRGSHLWLPVEAIVTVIEMFDQQKVCLIA